MQLDQLSTYVTQLFMPALVGVVGLGVSFIRSIAKNLQEMKVSVQELNLKMSHVSETVSDHEARLRVVERLKTRKRS